MDNNKKRQERLELAIADLRALSVRLASEPKRQGENYFPLRKEEKKWTTKGFFKAFSNAFGL